MRIALVAALVVGAPALAQTTFTVTNSNDTGAGSLRQAILDANAQPNGSLADEIHFDIPGAGPHTIAPASPLPIVTDPVVIDGYTQPGSSANTNPFGQGLNTVLLIELNGTSAGLTSGLVITAGATTVRGLVINRFSEQAIEIAQQGGDIIEGCFLNTNVAGTAGLGGGFSAIFIDNVSQNRIGGTTPAARNLLVGRSFHGIELGGPSATVNLVQGNLIGTDITGTASLGATFFGLNVFDGANNNLIGGAAPGAGNLISGNGSWGVALQMGASDNLVQGNYIGTDVTGLMALPNASDGIRIEANATDNVVGGTDAAARNVLSGNDGDGIEISDPGSTGNRIEGNYIGTDRTGLAPLPNSDSGVEIEDTSDNVVGGTAPGAGNLVAGNSARGVYILGGANDNLVQGNFIGTDATGLAPLGNGEDGVLIEDAPDNLVGGPDPAARNVIAGNGDEGVDLDGPDADDNVVQGNYIGAGADGNTLIGNAGEGVNADSGNRTSILGNLIAGNGTNAVLIESGLGHAVRGNAIYQNGGIGIDLGGDGATANDPGDLDDGANRLQNFPEITSATGDNAATLTIEFAIPSSTGSSTYPLTVEFFIADANQQEGQRFLGSETYGEAEAEQLVTRAFTPIGVVSDGDRIVATATDAVGNTSEFSAPVVVVGGAVATEPSDDLPPGSSLGAARPNPFDRWTTMSLRLMAAGRVTVAVYDAVGRRIAVLHDGPLPAGDHALRLDGGSLPSGVYVVRAAGADFEISRQVVILR
jgi:hypothetical protein